MDQSQLIDSLPTHLRRFARVQDAADYSPRDHAVWRYLLHQLTARLAAHAHPAYLDGLASTGIGLERIPTMAAMNARLGDFGWRAVVVDGFIPPAVFMEFQALRILPIALAMRSIDHILYTPAPDIVHESAGHAPLLSDPDYADFLQRFGAVGMKAIATRCDQAVYDAIRHLSIVKEATGSTPAMVAAAEAELAARLDANRRPSEAALLARLHWWTVEYGLVGRIDDYRLFGAGLLSSLGESVNCLDDRRVKKLPLTVDAVNWSYDITSEQPQLFVADSFQHLSQVLETFAERMCCRRGGAESVAAAIDSAAVCTATLDTGLQISGRFDQLLTDAMGNIVYLGTGGATQLAYGDRQLPGHSGQDHPAGFGSPLGAVVGLPRPLAVCSDEELRTLGMQPGQAVRLTFVSGFTLQGLLTHRLVRDGRNLLFSFANCTVRDRLGQPVFEPRQGVYELAAGSAVVSVSGGAADRSAFEHGREIAPEPTPRADFSENERALFALYGQVRKWREHGGADADALAACAAELRRDHADEWLLRLELLELPASVTGRELRAALLSELRALQRQSPTLARLIGYGWPGAALAA